VPKTTEASSNVSSKPAEGISFVISWKKKSDRSDDYPVFLSCRDPRLTTKHPVNQQAPLRTEAIGRAAPRGSGGFEDGKLDDKVCNVVNRKKMSDDVYRLVEESRRE